MTIRINPESDWKTNRLLGEILKLAKTGERVMFLVNAGTSAAIVQRIRVALSRSRQRNLARNKKIEEFTLKHECCPWTENGKRHDCIIMWTVKEQHHRNRELLDDLMKREA